MGWNPVKDIQKSLKKLEDFANQDVLDNVFGIESATDLIRKTAGVFIDPTSEVILGNKDRADAKVQRASVAADQAYQDAKKARDLPFMLANQSLAMRRRKLAESSLLASGSTGAKGMLSSVSAVGKSTLGA